MSGKVKLRPPGEALRLAELPRALAARELVKAHAGARLPSLGSGAAAAAAEEGRPTEGGAPVPVHDLREHPLQILEGVLLLQQARRSFSSRGARKAAAGGSDPQVNGGDTYLRPHLVHNRHHLLHEVGKTLRNFCSPTTSAQIVGNMMDLSRTRTQSGIASSRRGRDERRDQGPRAGHSDEQDLEKKRANLRRLPIDPVR